MTKILVTGGGGFIGSHLIDALVARGEEVTAIDIGDNIPRRLAHLSGQKNFRYVTADVSDRQKLEAAVPKNCQKIFHLAAIVGVRNYCAEPLKTIDVNIGGLRNTIDMALSRNTKVIFTSTSEIYGKNPRVPWGEDSNRVLGSTSIDRWSYSSSKAVCEHILFAVYKKYKLPIVIVRPFNVYGPRQNTIFVIPAMICKVLKGGKPVIYNSGEQTRCFTFIDDVIEGILRASENPGAEGEAFNLGSTQEITIANLAKMIIDIIGKSREIEPEFIDAKEIYDSYEDLNRRVPDVNKARRILGWKAEVELSIGLKKTISFFKEERNLGCHRK